jgi:hypothetical protein
MELKLVKEKTLKIEAKKRAAAKMNLHRMNQVSFFLLRLTALEWREMRRGNLRSDTTNVQREI